MEAVHAGDIWWHAMPFNTQVELLDAPLLRYAIELTHELDAKFDQKPKRTMSQVCPQHLSKYQHHSEIPAERYCSP